MLSERGDFKTLFSVANGSFPYYKASIKTSLLGYFVCSPFCVILDKQKCFEGGGVKRRLRKTDNFSSFSKGRKSIFAAP